MNQLIENICITNLLTYSNNTMGGKKKSTPMDGTAKSRIMKSIGKKNGGKYEKGGWVSRVQRAADKNANKTSSHGQEEGETYHGIILGVLFCLFLYLFIKFID